MKKLLFATNVVLLLACIFAPPVSATSSDYQEGSSGNKRKLLSNESREKNQHPSLLGSILRSPLTIVNDITNVSDSGIRGLSKLVGYKTQIHYNVPEGLTRDQRTAVYKAYNLKHNRSNRDYRAPSLGVQPGSHTLTIPGYAYPSLITSSASANCCPPDTFSLQTDVTLPGNRVYPECWDQTQVEACTAFSLAFASQWPRLLQNNSNADIRTSPTFIYYGERVTEQHSNGFDFSDRLKCQGNDYCNFGDGINLMSTIGAPLEGYNGCVWQDYVDTTAAAIKADSNGWLNGNNEFGPCDNTMNNNPPTQAELENEAQLQQNVCATPIMARQDSPLFIERILEIQNLIWGNGTGHANFAFINIYASSYFANKRQWVMPFSNNDFYNPKTGLAGDYFIGGHCVVLIGWDGENFIVRNSWGKNYGSQADGSIGDGHFLLPYAYVCGNSTTNPNALGAFTPVHATDAKGKSIVVRSYNTYSAPPYANTIGYFPSTYGNIRNAIKPPAQIPVPVPGPVPEVIH